MAGLDAGGGVVGLIACGGTVAGFAAARRLSASLGHPPWASPVLVTSIGIAIMLALAGVPFAAYDMAARPLRWLLGPALVALALVIDGNRGLLKAEAVPVLVAVVGGTVIGIASALGLAFALGLDATLLRALSVKTVTAPFVVAIMKSLGGPLELAAALSVLTGVIGALLVPITLARLGIRSTGQALGLGVSSHIVGTDWLTRRDPRAGGLAALAFVLTGLLAALVVPQLWPYLAG